MRFLITGATGFVGSWLAKKLAQEGHQVFALYRSEKDKEKLISLGTTPIRGDVTNLKSLIEASKGMDGVFHLAGVVGYSPAMRTLMEKVNVGGTQNIIKACQENSVGRLVYMSSVVAIGASFDGKTPLNENSKYNIKHLNLGYFETKRRAEELVKEAVNSGSLDAVILNPSTIYGPGDAEKGSRNTQLKVAQGKFPFYTSGGVNVISVEDVVDAIYSAWKVGRKGERYILAGENILIKDLFEMIAEAAGVKPPSVLLPNFIVKTIGKTGDLMLKFGKKGPLTSENAWTSIMFHWFDSSKAQKELGLKPSPAKEAIKKSVNWMKENNLL